MPEVVSDRPGLARLVGWRAYSVLLVSIAWMLIWMGGRLISLNGSPYYLIAGLTVLCTAVLSWKGDRRAAWLYGTLLVGTLAWAIWEVGADGWALMPRILAPAVLGIWFLTPWAYRSSTARATARARRFTAAIAAVLLFGALAIAIAAGRPSASARSPAPIASPGRQMELDWTSYGNDPGGRRFSTLADITPANVANLQLAWSFRTGHLHPGSAPPPFEVTPLQIGGTLYLCTPQNDIIALDAESGQQRWRTNTRSDPSGVLMMACRGVSYFRDSTSGHSACAERIITATIDARLIAVDAKDGKLCPRFGKAGIVDLRQGLGTVDQGYYYVTSAPQIANGNIILGGWVYDNQHINEPAGVVRAFDAVTGRFVWAFDAGRPGDPSQPGPGDSYTPGTPNSWAPISADEALGLVYLPTGNATPDWYGGHRRPFDDQYSSSVVALDVRTGAVRWSFQTTHHDLWDYDVPAQPTLYDLPVGEGRVPVLIQATKRGEIFVLDRRTGKAVTPIEEKPVPASHIPGERASQTQPFSVGMPSFAGPTLTEKMMWGVTPLDQLWCRIAFRKARYEGTMTPAGTASETIVYPGYNGGIDWGGVAVDVERDIMVVNSNRLAITSRLIPRAEADRIGIKPKSNSHQGSYEFAAQAGTPYAANIAPFLGPLGTPCQQPPYGLISGVDMKTRKLLWSRPFGTARDSGPGRIPSMLPILMGVPNNGGSVVTRGGLVFIGATVDRYFRAYETSTGKLLWQARLPSGAQATPMTYRSKKSGRQFVVIAAGGHGLLGSKAGDHVLAYALPKREK